MIAQDNSLFETHSRNYLSWAKRYDKIFNAELKALKQMVPQNGKGMEMDLGVGQYAIPLGIKYGTEASRELRSIASKRGLTVSDIQMGKLPYESNQFDFVLLLFNVLTMEDINNKIHEISRVLKKGGSLIIAFLDKTAFDKKPESYQKSLLYFYEKVKFLTTDSILSVLNKFGYADFSFVQTFSQNPDDSSFVEEPKNGYGEGVLVIMKVSKK